MDITRACFEAYPRVCDASLPPEIRAIMPTLYLVRTIQDVTQPRITVTLTLRFRSPAHDSCGVSFTLENPERTPEGIDKAIAALLPRIRDHAISANGNRNPMAD